MRALNRISAPAPFGGAHRRARGGGGYVDSFLSNSWPYSAIGPLQAYLLGVSTCVLVFVAYHFLLRPSDDNAAPRRRGDSRKRPSPFKARKRRAPSGLPTTAAASRAANDDPFLRPPARMAARPVSHDRVYRRLTNRISERAAGRVYRKTNRMVKHGRPAVGRDLAQCRAQYQDSTKLICRVVDHHPIARNRLRYNQKQMTKHSEVGSTKVQDSAYNDGSVWSSSSAAISDKPSYELFKHMNTQPLRREKTKSTIDTVLVEKAKKTATLAIPTDQTHTNSSNIDVSLRKMSDSDKENVNAQLAQDDGSNDATPKAKSSSTGSTKARQNIVDSSKGENKSKTTDPGTEVLAAVKDSTKLSLPEEAPSSVIEAQASVNGAKEEAATTATKKRLTVLISNGVFDYQQAANQNAALGLLDDLEIPYDTVDGMDPLQREKRDAFFAISGIRGNYPQIFIKEGSHTFLGGYDWLHGSKIEDLVELVSPDIAEPTKREVDEKDAASSAVEPTKARLTVLISNGVHDYQQAANQRAALELLDDLCIPYDTVDGMDPMQRETRDAFFKISGIRGNYPQLFASKDADDSYTFIGGYVWLQSSRFEDLAKYASK